MISKLIDKIVNTGAPIVVGLDPKLDFVPEDIKKRCFEEKGENLEKGPLRPSGSSTKKS